MTQLVLDRFNYPILELQRREHAEGGNFPRRWHVLIDGLSVRYSRHPARPFRFRDIMTGRARLFAWIPSQEALFAALLGRGLIYLCWGGLGRPGLRGIAERTILRRAEYVLVNDTVTQAEIERLAGRPSIMIPYAIDTEFFAFSPQNSRDDFLFCNSVNDRDPRVLLALAQAGQRVIWTVDDATLRGSYANRHHNLRLIPRVSYPELRRLYQTCRAFIMPLRRDVHAAGQTTIMEAVACGAPVLTSTGRTASIFSVFPSVSVVRGAAIEDWLTAVSYAATASEDAEGRARRSRSMAEQQWSFDRTLDRLEDILRGSNFVPKILSLKKNSA